MRMEKQIKLTLLLGSGISTPVGMPSTKEITKKVLFGEGIMRHPDGVYRLGKPMYAHMGEPDEYVPRVVKFLNRLKVEIDLYYLYQTERFTNYEDLHYVADQIYDSETGNYDNPTVKPFIDKIITDIVPYLVDEENEIKPKWQLRDLAWEAMNYITDVVWHLLSREPTHIDLLNSIKDACLDDQVSDVDIFTLNHDTVLEQCLIPNGIKFIDGFGEPLKNEIRYWDPELFKKGDFKVRLFKLHGSVNWFWFGASNGININESIGISLKTDIQHTESPQGKSQISISPRPLLLVGSFNKMLRYLSWIYADLYNLFLHSLCHTHRLVVCGYGFGDTGINLRISDWIKSSSDHRIIVIHPEPETLKKTARGVIINGWGEWINPNKLTIIKKRIEETSWQDIKNHLFS
jgi:hypothetical protein